MSAVARARVNQAQAWALPARLRLVPNRTRAARAPFVVTVISILAVGLTGLIFFSTLLQQQAFEIAQLDAEITALSNEKQSLHRDLERMSSPAGLGKAAAKLGMVPNANPVFIELTDGKVIGKPKPASRSDLLQVSP